MAARKKKSVESDRILHGREALLAEQEAKSKTKGAKKKSMFKQIGEAYKMAYKSDKSLPYWIFGTLLLFTALGVVASIVLKSPLYGITGFMMGLPISLIVMTRRIEKAAYKQIEGRTGATYSAISTLRRGWSFTEEPTGVDPKTQDLVWRGVGRGGVILVSEGPVPRVNRLVEAERKRVSRVLPDSVPITIIKAGNGEGQVPLPKLVKAIKKVKPKLTKAETSEVLNRLMAIGGSRLPIPKGIDPMRARPDRKGMRGR